MRREDLGGLVEFGLGFRACRDSFGWPALLSLRPGTGGGPEPPNPINTPARLWARLILAAPQ